ncbi:MAG: nitrilase-related carbon-nitrogen hydrolase [Bacillota bacterium]
MSICEKQKLKKKRTGKYAIVPVLYLISGIMLVAGNVLPSAAFLFYIGIILASYLILQGYITRINMYCFLTPYFLMLAISIWNNVFPYFLGIVLAVLIGDLFARVLYRALISCDEKSYRFIVMPAFFFAFDFIFQNIPTIGFIHMIPVLSPLSTHTFIIKAATVFGGRVVLLLVTLLLSAAANMLCDIKSIRISGIVVTICALLILTPNLMDLSADTEVLKEVSVAIIQGSYAPSSGNMDYEDFINQKFQYYMSLAESVDADIIVFPETELGIYDTENKVDQAFRNNIIDASKRLGDLTLFTVTEGNSVTKSKDERFISALLLNDGEIEGISRKRNLVPLSETRDYSKGKDYDVYETRFGKIGVSICYDMNANTVERLKNNGAQMILAPFNDSGFDFIYHNIHRYFPVMKAAECAVPIVVANEDGISQIIDHNGRIIAELGYGEKGSITQNIEVMNAKSLYLLFGRYIEWILFLAIANIATISCLGVFHLRKPV